MRGRRQRTATPILPTQADRLAVLGSDTASNWTTVLGPSADAAECTAKRLAKAQKLSGARIQLAKATSRAGTLQAAWTLNRLVLAYALSFDVRGQPVHVVQGYAEALAGLAHRVC